MLLFFIDFDHQFVLNSIQALGEDESETETFLHSLNPARKNSLVKCNLQYVLALLKSLGARESDSEKNNNSKYNDKDNHNDVAEPKKHFNKGKQKTNISQKSQKFDDNNHSNEDDWRNSISQSSVDFPENNSDDNDNDNDDDNDSNSNNNADSKSSKEESSRNSSRSISRDQGNSKR